MLSGNTSRQANVSTVFSSSPKLPRVFVITKLTSVFYASVLAAIDHEFLHSSLRIHSNFDNFMTKFIVNHTGQTHENLTSICFLQ